MKNLIIQSFIGISLSLSLTACGKGGSETKAEPVEKLRNWFKEDVRISCPSGDCPEGVGMVIFIQHVADGMQMARCTASLISSNRLITNSHCDKGLTPDQAFLFVNISGQTRFFALQSKIFDQMDVTEPSGIDVGMGEDLEIWELQQDVPQLTPRGISREIPADMSHLVAFVINDTDQINKFSQMVLQKEICSTLAHEGIRQSGTEDRAIGLGLHGCQVIHGNSGSPVFLPNDFSLIQVVVNAGPEEGQKGGFGFGNRVHCLDLPGIAAPGELCTRAWLPGQTPH